MEYLAKEFNHTALNTMTKKDEKVFNKIIKEAKKLSKKGRMYYNGYFKVSKRVVIELQKHQFVVRCDSTHEVTKKGIEIYWY